MIAAYRASSSGSIPALSWRFPPHLAGGLDQAKPDDLVDIEISPSGLGLHFPKLDADLYLPALLEGALGSSAVLHAVRHLRKPMDLGLWLGANRSDTEWGCEDLQRRHGAKDAVLCAEQRATLH